MNELVHKAYVCKLQEVSEGERSIVAVISTGAVDMDGEIMLPGGCDLSDFRKNPVVLWAHNYYEPPIAKASPPGWVRYDKSTGTIKAKMIFAETEFAEDIFKLYQGEFLRSFSVGFSWSSAEWVEPTEADVKRHPEWAGARRVAKRWTMKEYSGCPIGINSEAIAEQVAKSSVCEMTIKALGLTEPETNTEEPKPIEEPEIEPEADSEPTPPSRRIIHRPESKPVQRRVIVAPAKKRLTTAADVVNIVMKVLDRLRGRC